MLSGSELGPLQLGQRTAFLPVLNSSTHQGYRHKVMIRQTSAAKNIKPFFNRWEPPLRSLGRKLSRR